MPSLRAWVKRTKEPTYRQVVQCPIPEGLRELGHAGVANLIAVEVELLHIAHQTKLLVRSVHIPDLRAWIRGSRELAYLQVVQRPTGNDLGKDLDVGVTPAQALIMKLFCLGKLRLKC